MQSTTMLFVKDVEVASRWYQDFLGVKSGHGGREFDMLLADDKVFLQLHLIEPGHHDHEVSTENPLGHGVVLVVYVNDIEAVFAKAGDMGIEVISDLQFNEQANMHEFVVKDGNGYSVMVCQAVWMQT